MTGKTISHYRIVGELGRGGMGVVYRAQDEKLHRAVALKLLPPHALTSEDDRARFYREARAAAALNHVNIGHIYEIDEAETGDGVTQPFIAMEYIDGETLGARIARGPIPLEDAVAIATQIAAGLRAAHAKDIVHRDIKSGNIMLAADGGVKILDFGLAKTAASTKLTQMGSTVGTASYMSPEQARGVEVDRRTDIWSLGVILYEMVAGRLPFAGDYEQAITYGILNEDPESLTSLRAGVPLEVDRIVAKLLAKDPDLRYQHVDELPADLKAIDLVAHSGATRLSTTSQQAAKPAVTPRKGGVPIWMLAAGIAAALLLGFGSASLISSEPDAEGRQVRRYLVLDVAHIEGLERERTFQSAYVSPDGKRIAFSADFKLWIRNVDNLRSVPLPGTERTTGGEWLPDGSGVVFTTREDFRRILLENNEVATIADYPSDAAWWEILNDGSVGAISGQHIVRLQSNGSREAVTMAIPGLLNRGFAPLPSGRGFLVVRADSEAVSHIAHAQDESVRDLIALPPGTGDASDLFLAPSGHLLFSAGDDIWAMRLDLDRSKVIGQPQRVATNARDASVGRDGVLYYTRSQRSDSTDFLFYSDTGLEIGREEGLPSATAPEMSPDGRYLAVATADGTADRIWVLDRELGGMFELPFDRENPWRPSWAPDGQHLVYQSGTSQSDSKELWVQSIDGGSEARLILSGDDIAWGPTWSPDGKWIVYTHRPAEGGTSSIYRVAPDGASDPEPVVQERFGAAFATMSPDGRYVAYWSLRNGQRDIYVSSFPEGDRHYRVTTRGGLFPKWRGDYIYYNDFESRHLMKVRVSTEPTFRADEPVPVMEENLAGDSPRWDVSENGDVIVVLRGREARVLPQVVAVENWTETVNF